MQSGWRVGSILGIPLFIDRSWFIILALITLANGINPEWQTAWGDLAWVMGFAMALLLFGSVLLHELGHSVAAKVQGIGVNSITLFLFGGIASIDRESKTPWGALKVAIAGPLVSFGLFVLLSILVQGVSLPQPITVVLMNVAYINLVLTLFNLIPGLPLDGGQVLKAVVWKMTNSRMQGIRWAARSGQILGWLAIALGLGRVLLNQDYSGLWIAAIGWFALRNAAAYQQVTSLQEAMLALTAADAMGRDFRVVDAHTSLRDFAEAYLLEDQHPPVYFAASEGRYRGLVSIDSIRTIERGQWNQRTLQDIAQPLLTIPSVRETTPLTEVIAKLEDLALPRLTVLTPADAVAGVLDRGDIVRAIADRLGLGVAPAMIQRIKEEGAYPPGLQLAAIARTVADD
ncbi:site-2 protease family protein [Leptolyngbya sp. BL0902]|uniref:site-2 protease family protein n=1 Tax=Leptolyngbya sp. BL0902 TaxID=1115757 RepID=UPI0018E7F6F2|nr:site-2 protease family protein [Leptolyngbya sp. BL0902]QQE64265.1 site-2 protease family protein [Leptolyngbya sp. BL0902]